MPRADWCSFACRNSRLEVLPDARQRRKRPIELAPRILVFPEILVGLRERQTQSRLEQSSAMRADSCRCSASSITRAASAFSCSPNRLSPMIARSSSCVAGLTSERSCSLRSACRSRSAADRTLPRTWVGSASRNTEAMSSLTSSARVFSASATRACHVATVAPMMMAASTAAAARDGDGVTRRELAHAVPEAVRAREHRSPVEIAFEVLHERVDGGISLVRLLLQRLENDRVEIAPERSAVVAAPRRRSAAAGPLPGWRLRARRASPASACTAVSR